MHNQQLIDAAIQGNLDKVKEFTSSGADLNIENNIFNRTPVYLAAYHGHLEVVRYLIGEEEVDFSVKNYDGSTLLTLTMN